MGLRQAIRAASPGPLRRGVALTRRAWRDSGIGGERPRFAEQRDGGQDFAIVTTVVQPIRSSAFAEGKLANLRLGAERIDGIVIAPGEILSFWRLVGRPSAAAGFQLGRTIRGDVVVGELGGGLCQLSGILYEAALRGGLEIAERHAHSRDLYTEEQRFTALGLDATVVWPHRDLRLRNGSRSAVQVRMAVTDASVSASMHAAEAREPMQLDVNRTDGADWREVVVHRSPSGEGREWVSRDLYAVIGA